MPVSQKRIIPKINFESFKSSLLPYDDLSTGKLMIKGWADSIDEDQRLRYGRTFVYHLIKSYWKKFYPDTYPPPLFEEGIKLKWLDNTTLALADSLGTSASKLGLIESSYLIGAIYTATIPGKLRSKNGIYFTPPAITSRLLNLVEKEGIDWQKAKVLDPACGGGAFLAPVALRIVSNLKYPESNADAILSHIENHLKGYEIDFFAAWLSQVFVEIALSKFCLLAGRRIKTVITVCNTLNHDSPDKYDLIVGNPPYGKIKLEDSLRSKFKESLYGHANLYGLFTHVALNRISGKGIIAFVTPTSFLAGEYFRNLRELLLQRMTPKIFDFIIFRKGIFDDVLQETMLATYKANDKKNQQIIINEIHLDTKNSLEITPLGAFSLPAVSNLPWILPRSTEQSRLVHAFEKLHCRIADWGYEVKTGPLVWNRHKTQLTSSEKQNSFPLIWAEAISSEGKFLWKADKKNHKLFFKIKKGDGWLITDYPCVLLQRTTAKEQQRRLIAAVLPWQLVKRYKFVVIENHINIIKPVQDGSILSLELVAAFLNSSVADLVFRCISGSVAVSAYELETMPLPSAAELIAVQKSVGLADKKSFETELLKLYNLR
jgi:adenine-specific DNA-methyltransferase